MKDGSHVGTKEVSDELRERATRMAVELRRDPETRGGAIRRVSEQLGMHPETLRNWVRQGEIDRSLDSVRIIAPEATAEAAARFYTFLRDTDARVQPAGAWNGWLYQHRNLCGPI